MTNGKIQKKVLKKLSAVRAVLSNKEREVLDAIVLGEARAHEMATKKTGRAARKSSDTISETKARNNMTKKVQRKGSAGSAKAQAHKLHQARVSSTRVSITKAKARAHKLHQARVSSTKADAQAHKLHQARVSSTKADAQAHKLHQARVSSTKADAQAHLFGLGDQIAPKTVPPTTLVPIEFDPNKEEYHPAEE